MVTIATNLSCFAITPLWLLAATGQTVELPFLEMAQKLLVLVVLPMVAAQLLRLYAPLGALATQHKGPIGAAAMLGVLAMVGLGAIGAGVKMGGDLRLLVGWDKLAMLAAVMTVHLGLLATGLALARLFRLERADGIAVGIAGSQKTLMVGLHVAQTYFDGLTMLPMIAYHVGQLLADTVVADWLRRRGERLAAETPEKQGHSDGQTQVGASK
ncbi:MAG: bile acid:sodium symporter, partial [Planctomycetales bacterium]|nr:bile acid:sodium symporter [Planctomycetales bacterium]